MVFPALPQTLISPPKFQNWMSWPHPQTFDPDSKAQFSIPPNPFPSLALIQVPTWMPQPQFQIFTYAPIKRESLALLQNRALPEGEVDTCHSWGEVQLPLTLLGPPTVKLAPPRGSHGAVCAIELNECRLAGSEGASAGRNLRGVSWALNCPALVKREKPAVSPSQPLAPRTKSVCVPGEEGRGPIWPEGEMGAVGWGEERESPQAAPPPSSGTSEAKTSPAKRFS